MATQYKNEIRKQVQLDYKYIKSSIMSQAKSGQYDDYDKCKNITVDVYSEQLLKFVSRKLNQDIIIHGGIRNQSATYYISNPQMYNYYLSEIRNLANVDKIKISVVFKDNAKRIEFEGLPCTVNNHIVYPRDYALYLRCSIQY